jgi:hypothetical protein
MSRSRSKPKDSCTKRIQEALRMSGTGWTLCRSWHRITASTSRNSPQSALFWTNIFIRLLQQSKPTSRSLGHYLWFWNILNQAFLHFLAWQYCKSLIGGYNVDSCGDLGLGMPCSHARPKSNPPEDESQQLSFPNILWYNHDIIIILSYISVKKLFQRALQRRLQSVFMRWERNQNCEALNYEGDQLAWTHGPALQTSMAVTCSSRIYWKIGRMPKAQAQDGASVSKDSIILKYSAL